VLLELRCLAPKVLTVICMEIHNLKITPMDRTECAKTARKIHAKLFDKPMECDREKYLTSPKISDGFDQSRQDYFNKRFDGERETLLDEEGEDEDLDDMLLDDRENAIGADADRVWSEIKI
jgi:hypothetical protein